MILSPRLLPIALLLLAIQATDPHPLQDDGFGDCPGFLHPHADAPGVCFDDDDRPVVPDSQRDRLTKDGDVVKGKDKDEDPVLPLEDYSLRFLEYAMRTSI